MNIYRIVDKENYLNGIITNEKVVDHNINTFEYDGEEYIHFFVLPEHADIYQKSIYDRIGIYSLVLQCDVPYSLLKDNCGVGMYNYYNYESLIPFLEVRLNVNDFDNKFVIGVAHEVPDFWKNKTVYNRYLNNVVMGKGQGCVLDIDLYVDGMCKDVKPEVNENFNFFEYFEKKDIIDNKSNNAKSLQTYNNMKMERTSKSFKHKIKSILSKKNR